MTNWRDVDIDVILDYSDANTGLIHRYDRIMRQYEIDAMLDVRGGLFDLKRSIHISADKVGSHLDKLEHMLGDASERQGRIQTITVVLTIVIALATVAYTWVTWHAVEVQRAANELQNQRAHSHHNGWGNHTELP